MNSAILRDDAAKLGIETEISQRGRLRLFGNGKAGEIIKCFAAQGLDVVCDHDGLKSKSWVVTRGALVGDDVRALVMLDKTNGFAYGYTCAV